MNRYALASTLPPSCNKLACLFRAGWLGEKKPRAGLEETGPKLSYPGSRVSSLAISEKEKTELSFSPLSEDMRVASPTPPLFFLRLPRGTWSVSQKSRFYRPISRRRLTESPDARARTRTRVRIRTHTPAHARTHTRARVRARADHASAGWSRPRVIITYTGYTRDEGNDDSRNGPRSEKGPRRREIACPPS